MVKTIFHSFASEILFSPLEDKIHIFAPPCNILYIFLVNVANKSLKLKLLEVIFKPYFPSLSIVLILFLKCNRDAGISIIGGGGAHIHILLFTDCKDNRF